jgi:hypothetical protein
MKPLFFVLVFLSGCTLFMSGKDSPKTAKGKYYSVHFGQPYWVFKKDERSDYVFENSQDGRILLSNSFCEEYQDQPLDVLASKTFKTIKSFRVKESRYTTFRDREAYRVQGSGLVDGVSVNLTLLNTRRDNCYFDFLAITPSKAMDQKPIFDDFLKTVVFR